MDGKHKPRAATRPADSTAQARTAEDKARQAFDEIVRFCRTCDSPFRAFEQNLLTRLFALGCLLVRLFLACRHERLEITPPAGYRRGNAAGARSGGRKGTKARTARRWWLS